MLLTPPPSAARTIASSKTRLAPMAGLNLSSPITAMKDGTALVLDDWVCREEGVVTRGGFETVTEDHGAVKALFSYPGQIISSSATKLFAGQSQMVTGLTNGDWVGEVVTNSGGRHLVLVNGADYARRYDGMTFSISAITGVDSRKLSTLALHNRRLFAGDKDSLNLWYLATDAIEGEARLLPLAPLCTLGGTIQSVASFQTSGGKSAADQLMIATTKGELIIFAGTDPDAAETWKHVGTWTIPRPVGKRCFLRVGATAAVLTVKGLLSIPKLLTLPDDQTVAASISGKVDPLLQAMLKSAQTDVCLIESSAHDLTMINLNGHQLVKSDTGAWSRFTGLPASCWLEHEGELFFGTSGGEVRKYGSDTDGGAPIRSFLVDAYSRFGSQNFKYMRRVRPMYKAAHPYVPRIEMLTDFKDPPADFAAANIDDRYWYWSDITWPRQPMPWLREVSSRLGLWRGLTGRGTAAALQMSIQTKTPITFTAYDLAWENGQQ